MSVFFIRGLKGGVCLARVCDLKSVENGIDIYFPFFFMLLFVVAGDGSDRIG